MEEDHRGAIERYIEERTRMVEEEEERRRRGALSRFKEWMSSKFWQKESCEEVVRCYVCHRERIPSVKSPDRVSLEKENELNTCTPP